MVGLEDWEKLERLTNIPRLRHSRHTTGQVTRQQRHNSRQSQRQLGWHIPHDEIISLLSAEPLVFNQKNDRKRHSPITEQGHKVANDKREMLSASNSQNGNYERVDKRPDESRNSVEVVTEKLHAETGGVVDGNIIPEHGEDEENQAELREREGVEGFPEETAQAMEFVRIRQDWIHRGADCCVSEAGADDGHEDRGDRDSGQGQTEDLPGLGVGWVVAVVVGGDGAPARCIREVDGEEAEEGTGQT
jgi:hypothetical protein